MQLPAQQSQPTAAPAQQPLHSNVSVTQPLSLVQLGSSVSRTADKGGGHGDLSTEDMKSLRGELEDLTSELVERRKQKLLAKRLRVHTALPTPSASSSTVSSESAAVPLSATPEEAAVTAVAPVLESRQAKSLKAAIDAQAGAMLKQPQRAPSNLSPPRYQNEGAARASSPRFASAHTGAKSKAAVKDAKNPWWLNPPPWWLPPPPEWGAPPPSIYSGFYNPYSQSSQSQSFHRVPAAHPAYNPYPLPY